MGDLISRSELLKYSSRVVEYDEAGFSMEYNAVPTEVIKNAPTVEAKPVVHGKWIKLDGDWKDVDTKKPLTIHQCSRCGAYFRNAPHDFCSQCGADMRKKVE